MSTDSTACQGSSSVLIGSHCCYVTGDRREITPSDAAQRCPDWPVNQTRPCPQDLRAPCEGFAEDPFPGRWSVLLRHTLSVREYTHSNFSLAHNGAFFWETRNSHTHSNTSALHSGLFLPYKPKNIPDICLKDTSTHSQTLLSLSIPVRMKNIQWGVKTPLRSPHTTEWQKQGCYFFQDGLLAAEIDLIPQPMNIYLGSNSAVDATGMCDAQ